VDNVTDMDHSLLGVDSVKNAHFSHIVHTK